MKGYIKGNFSYSKRKDYYKYLRKTKTIVINPALFDLCNNNNVALSLSDYIIHNIKPNSNNIKLIPETIAKQLNFSINDIIVAVSILVSYGILEQYGNSDIYIVNHNYIFYGNYYNLINSFENK